MAEKTQQTAGNGVVQPVIPQQNTEPVIEIVEEDAARAIVPTQDTQPHPTDADRAGSYDYDTEDDTAGQQSDARTGHAQQGDGGQAAAGETQEQLTARQRRRRRENAARDRERQELATLRQENARLRQGQQQIDSRLSAVEQAGIDGQISSIETELSRANLVMKRAMEAQNADDFVQAQEIRDAFRDRLAKLRAQKEQSTRQAESPQQAATPTMPDGMTQAQVHFARIFASRHPWFNPNLNARDRDSDSVRQLDGEMLREGLDPSKPEYWIELERRIQEDLPHKFQAANEGGGQSNGGAQPRQQGTAQNANGRASGGPKLPGSGAGSSGAGGGVVKFHLSAARKQAMIDTGNWDDPVRRERQIRYFMKWDADNAQKN